MKIIFMQQDAMRDIERGGNGKAFMRDAELAMDRLYGVRQRSGPTLFDHSGKVMKSTLPTSEFDKREPWQQMTLDTGKGIGRVLTKGEIDDEE